MSRPDGGTGIGSKLRTRSRKAPTCDTRSTRNTSGKSVAATSSRVTIRAPIKFDPDIVSFLPARRFKLPDGRLLKKALRKAPGLEGPAWPENEKPGQPRAYASMFLGLAHIPIAGRSTFDLQWPSHLYISPIMPPRITPVSSNLNQLSNHSSRKRTNSLAAWLDRAESLSTQLLWSFSGSCRGSLRIFGGLCSSGAISSGGFLLTGLTR
jgi:hypothetical protein